MRAGKSNHIINFVCGALILIQPYFALAQSSASKPIRKDALLEVVHRNLLSTRELIQRVEQRGVDFQLTSQDEIEFRQAGARPELLAAVRANFRETNINAAKNAGRVAIPAKYSAPIQPGALGIVMVALTPEMARQSGMNEIGGALVRSVAPSGAAAKAGIRAGDVITQFNGRPIIVESLREAISNTPAGTKINLTLLRQNRFEKISVILGAASANNVTFTYDDLTDQSLAALQKNDWELAENLLSQAIKMNPQLPTAYSLMGYTLLYGRGDTYNAERSMRKAIEHGGAASFEVWHAQGSSFKDAVRGSLFISKNGVIFKSGVNADEFDVPDSDIKEAALNSYFGREHNAFHLEVRTNSGKTRNYNFAPRTANQMESLLILNLIKSY